MRPFLVGLLGLVLPGAGHAVVGRRRMALLFVIPVVLLVAGWVLAYLLSGRTSVLGFLLTPWVLPALAVVNIAVAAWRIAAAVDAARLAGASRAAFGALGLAIVLLVVAPHFIAGRDIASTNDFLDSMFASTDGSNTPSPASSDMPTNSDGGFIVPSGEPQDGWSAWIGGGPTPTPVPVVRGPMGSGVGTLPSLGAAVPWTRAGAVAVGQ